MYYFSLTHALISFVLAKALSIIMTWYVDSEHGHMGENSLPQQPACPEREKTISPLLNTIAQGKTEPKI